MVEQTTPVEVLQARVAALRRLASEDVIPAVHETVQATCTGEEITINRTVAGPGRLLGYKKAEQLRFQSPEDANFRISEAAVVFGATAADADATLWRGTKVVELGCGAGYAGVVMAMLGARVTLTDLPAAATHASTSITLNRSVIRIPASASFCMWDWSDPYSDEGASRGQPFLPDLASADVVVAVDPVSDSASLRDFGKVLQAVFGLDIGDGQRGLCRDMKQFILVHKHQQSYCIGGYSAPLAGAHPSITNAEECERCLFRRELEDLGLVLQPWLQAPTDYKHPFVECWLVSRAPNR